MHRFLKVLTFAAVTGFLLAGCSATNNSPVVNVSPTATPEATAIPVPPGHSKPVSVVLKPQHGSGQPGTATLEDLGNSQTKVTLTMTGKKVTVAEPAHIHTGTCAKPGNIVYPLTDVVNGSSVTTINVDLATILSTGTLINVHKSAKEIGVYISCGEFANAVPKANPSPMLKATPTAMPKAVPSAMPKTY